MALAHEPVLPYPLSRVTSPGLRSQVADVDAVVAGGAMHHRQVGDASVDGDGGGLGDRQRPVCHPISSMTASRSSSSSASVASTLRLCPRIVDDPGLDLDRARRGRPQRVAEDETLRDAVAAVRGRRDRRAEDLAGRLGDVAHRVDHGVGGAGGARLAPRRDDRRAPLLDGADEVALQPRLVADDLRRRPAADLRVVEVGELGGGVVAPDREVASPPRPATPARAASWERPRFSSSIVIANQRSAGISGALAGRDQAVGVARIAHHQGPHVRGRVARRSPCPAPRRCRR